MPNLRDYVNYTLKVECLGRFSDWRAANFVEFTPTWPSRVFGNFLIDKLVKNSNDHVTNRLLLLCVDSLKRLQTARSDEFGRCKFSDHQKNLVEAGCQLGHSSFSDLLFGRKEVN